MEEVEEKPHICENCYLVFESEDLLDVHSILCNHRKPYACESCPLVFENDYDLIDHKLAAHENDNTNLHAEFKEEIPENAQDGTKPFESESDELCFTTHMERHTHKCEVCDVALSGAKQIDEHLQTHKQTGISTNIFTANLRKQNVDSSENAETKHFLNVQEITDVQKVTVMTYFHCSFCKTVVKQSELKQHFETHKSIRLDDEPSEIFKKHKSIRLDDEPSENFKKHESIPLDEHSKKFEKHKKIRLDESSEDFGKHESIRLNEPAKKGPEETKQPCENRIREKPRLCEICGKWITHHFYRHMKVHDILCKCDLCNETFTKRVDLKRHKCARSAGTGDLGDTESDGEPFEKRSNNSAVLVQERNVELFPCKICGKTFKWSHVRRRHERVHTGVKPFSCDLCGKSYTEKSNMIKHRQTKHNAF